MRGVPDEGEGQKFGSSLHSIHCGEDPQIGLLSSAARHGKWRQLSQLLPAANLIPERSEGRTGAFSKRPEEGAQVNSLFGQSVVAQTDRRIWRQTVAIAKQYRQG